MSTAVDSWGRTLAPLTSAEADLLQYVRGLAKPCPIMPHLRVLPLDLNDPRQREFFEARVGGTEAEMGRHFPKKREIFDATAAWQARNGVATLPQAVHLPAEPSSEHPAFPGWRPETAQDDQDMLLATTWQPAAFISALEYVAGTGESQVGGGAVLTVPNNPQMTELVLEIYDIAVSPAALVASTSTGPQKAPSLSVGAQGTLRTAGDMVEAYATGYYVPAGTSMAVPVLTVAMVPGEQKVQSEEAEGSQPALTLNVTNPVNIVTPQGSTIKVALNRNNVIKDCDYYYQDSPGNQNTPTSISLAVTGTATAPAGNSFDTVTATPPNGSLTLVSRTGGASVSFPASQIAGAVTTATSVLTWTLNPAQYQGSPPWSSGNLVDLYFTLNFGMNNAPGGVPNASVFVTSDPNVPSGLANTAKTPPIQFLWGCLADDEPVRMADGSLRAAREVAVGERVRAPGGGVLRVVNVTRGREPKPMLRLVLEDGRSVRMTDGHPVRTAQGWTLARDVAAGDRVETEDGPRAVAAVEWFRHEGGVANLVLAPLGGQADDLDPHDAAFYAGGVLVGDNRLQAHAGARALDRAAISRAG